MKYTSIIIIALLLCGCSPSKEIVHSEIGRYQIALVSGGAMKIDTVTGRTWILDPSVNKRQFTEIP
jgi:hypothetical protein